MPTNQQLVLPPINDPSVHAQVDRLASRLPEVTRKTSHGSPGWRTGGKTGKFFAYFSDRHHGTPHIALLVKTGGMDELEDLVEAQPQTYFKPAYYGAAGWIGCAGRGRQRRLGI